MINLAPKTIVICSYLPTGNVDQSSSPRKLSLFAITYTQETLTNLFQKTIVINFAFTYPQETSINLARTDNYCYLLLLTNSKRRSISARKLSVICSYLPTGNVDQSSSPRKLSLFAITYTQETLINLAQKTVIICYYLHPGNVDQSLPENYCCSLLLTPRKRRSISLRKLS